MFKLTKSKMISLRNGTFTSKHPRSNSNSELKARNNGSNGYLGFRLYFSLDIERELDL